MKISKKLHKAIRDAIERAAMEVITENEPVCDSVPPEGWTAAQRAVFDQAHEVAYRANKRIDALLGVAGESSKAAA
jgi:hypothetical protein